MPQLVTPEDLRKFVHVSDTQISPNGSQIVFVRRVASKSKIGKYESNLWIVSTANGKPRPLTQGEQDAHPRWSPDGTEIAFLATRGEDAESQIYVISLDGGEAVAVSDFPEGSIRDFRWSPDGKGFAVSFREAEPDFTRDAKKQREESGASDPVRVLDDIFYRFDGDGYFGHQRHALHVVDAATGERRKIFSDTNGFYSYDWSPNGKEIIAAGNRRPMAILEPWEDQLFRVDVASGEISVIEGLPEGMKFSPSVSPDGKHVCYAGQLGRETWGCMNSTPFVLDLETGELKNLGEQHDYCLVAVTLSDTAEASFEPNFLWSPDGKTLLADFGTRGERQIWRIDVAEASFTPLTSGRTTWSVGNMSSDGKHIAATRCDAVSLSEVVRVDLAAGELPTVDQLTDFNADYHSGTEIRDSDPFVVTTPSGTDVHGWIMTPPGFDSSKKYPTVLEVHGGPHTQYGEAFFHEFQVLAAAGYVVAFSNPRGSKGYGESHCSAIRGNWGEADWEDVQTVTAHLKSLDFVDDSRLAIMGGSYGGFMTNWAIGHTHDFKAAITDRCVSNMLSCGGSSDWPLTDEEYWGGYPWNNEEHLWKCSPLAHFESVKTPTLVIHSEGDLRCNVEQGEQVFTALKTLGVPTRFVRYPFSTSHGMSRGGPPDLRIHRLGQILSWYAEWL